MENKSTLLNNEIEFSSRIVKSIAEQIQETSGCRILGNSELYLSCETQFETAVKGGLLGKVTRSRSAEDVYLTKRLTVRFEDNSICHFNLRIKKTSTKDVVVQAQRFIQIFIDDLNLTRAVWQLEGNVTVHFTKNTNGLKNLKTRVKNYLDYFFTI